MTKSGLYTRNYNASYTFETRLDVDNNYPQMKVSWTCKGPNNGHIIADLAAVADPNWGGSWEGNIIYRTGAVGNWQVNSSGSLGPAPAGGEVPDKIRVNWGQDANGAFIYTKLYKSGTDKYWQVWYDPTSDYFHQMEMEIDYESGYNPIISFNPHDDPNHAPGLANEDITITSTFRKAGIDITTTASANAVPSADRGADNRWSNAELHDAMQTHWSADEAKAWKMWVFYGSRTLEDPGFLTYGIMFDTIGNFERCGTAVFQDALADKFGLNTWQMKRETFQTICHEMGHAFNLYHSFMKTLNTEFLNTIVEEPEARSYMNYPWRVNGGRDSFYANFEYKFSDQDMLFLRHAPEDFIIMGGSDFGDDHGAIDSQSSEGAPDRAKPALELKVRSNKANPTYEFLEMVNVELKLTNTGDQPKTIAPEILEDLSHMSIFVSRNRGKAKEYKPYSRSCYGNENTKLAPGESIYSNVFLSAGKYGWVVSEPGRYEVRLALTVHGKNGDETITSNTFSFSVSEPDRTSAQTRKEQETLAQDLFVDDVGRTIAFGGTKVLTGANNTLNELLERFPNSKAAAHAAVTLALPNTREYKTIGVDSNGNKTMNASKPEAAAGAAAKKVLVDQSETAVETLGHIGFKKVSDRLAHGMSQMGDKAGAVNVLENVLSTMDKRGVKLPDTVKQEIGEKVNKAKKK